MNEKNLDKLINAASEKLGTSPDKLKKTLENGDIKGLSAGLSKSDKEKLREVLANKELMEKLRRASGPDDAVPALYRLTQKNLAWYMAGMILLHSSIYFLLESLSLRHLPHALLRLALSDIATAVFVWYFIKLFIEKILNK